MPLYCPDNSEMLSGSYRKQCPDPSEICNQHMQRYLLLHLAHYHYGDNDNRLISFSVIIAPWSIILGTSSFAHFLSNIH